jgi:hypothetical protein
MLRCHQPEAREECSGFQMQVAMGTRVLAKLLGSSLLFIGCLRAWEKGLVRR